MPLSCVRSDCTAAVTLALGEDMANNHSLRADFRAMRVLKINS